MTKENVIRMAREAGFPEAILELSPTALERFAALVASAEREECAKVCEEFGKTPTNMSQAWRNGCLESATEIRERAKHDAIN